MPDILELARECGAVEALGSALWMLSTRELEAFAQRIREDERERCAAVCDQEVMTFAADSNNRSAMVAGICAAAIRRGGDHG